MVIVVGSSEPDVYSPGSVATGLVEPCVELDGQYTDREPQACATTAAKDATLPPSSVAPGQALPAGQ